MTHTVEEIAEVGTGLQKASDAPKPSAVTTGAMAPVTDLLRIAVEKGTPVAELKELVDLHERMEARQARKEFAAAMRAFQQECPPIRHERTAEIVTKTGAKYKYTYAELDVIARTINPILAKHGLSYRWDSKVERDSLTCVCTVSHEAGHSESSSISLPVDNASAMSPQQKVGAALTFAQRRSLSGALGLTTTDDDPDAAGEDPTPVTDDQLTAIRDLITEKKLSDSAFGRFLKFMEADSLETIRAADYDKAIKALQQVKAK